MAKSSTITKDESNILVAIAKLETHMANMADDISAARLEIKEINTGTGTRLLNLESNAVTKLEHNLLDERVENLEKSRIAYRATMKAWIIMGGGAWSIVLIVASVLVAKFFGA